MEIDQFVEKWCDQGQENVRAMEREMMLDLQTLLKTYTLDSAFREGYLRALEEVAESLKELREG